MKSLYLRIYLTLVVLLLAFAFGSAWLFQRQIEQERGMGAGPVLRAAGHKDDWCDPARLSGQDVHQLLLRGDDRLAVQRGEHGAYFHFELAHGIAFVGQQQAAGDGMRFRDPEISGDKKVFEGNKIEGKEVWVEAAQRWF